MRNGVYNAVINSTTLDIGERGLLIGWLDLSYGKSSGQGFGGIVLYKSIKDPIPAAGHFITRCLQVADSPTWEKLKGRPLRVELKDGIIYGIGHFLNDDWFIPSEDFK